MIAASIDRSKLLRLQWQDPHDPRRAHFKPSPQQAEFIRDRQHWLKFLIGGYGIGKTHALGYHAVLGLFVNRGTTGGAIGETWEKVRQDLLPAVQSILDWSGVEYKHHKTEHWIHVPAWRSTVQFMSAEEPDRIKGQNWAWAVGNEPGLWREDAFLNTIARLRVPCAWKFFALGGTPEGFNWLYRHAIKEPGQEVFTGRHPEVRVWNADTRDSFWLDQSYAQRIIDRYPPDLVDEKIKGMFTHVGVGAIYPHFSDANIQPVTRDRALRLVLMLDFNIAPAVALLGQHRPHPRLGIVVEVLREVWMRRGTTADVISEVCRVVADEDLIDKHDCVLEVIGDQTGESTHATGAVCYDEVFRVLHEHGIGWENRTPRKNPPRKDRYAIVNGALYHGRLVIHPGCERLGEDFREVTYKEGTLLPDAGPLGDKTHLSDACGYDVFSVFGVNNEILPPDVVTPGGKTRVQMEVERGASRASREQKAAGAQPPPWHTTMREAPWRGK